MDNTMYEMALTILKKIENLGYEAYIVGGYPRDHYLGINSIDIDICTSMLPNQIQQNFSVIENHEIYGNCMIEEQGFLYEITTYRKDTYNQNRYPKVTFVSTLEEDLQRRDFSINTLCINQEGKYVDLLNARKDMDSKIIKMIGNADDRIKEDPLRIIRAIRFSSDLNFDIDSSLCEAIQNNKQLLKTLTKSKIEKEIHKIRNHKKYNYWIQYLDLKPYLP